MTKGRVPLTLAAAIGDGQSRRLSAIFIPWVGRRPMIPPVGMTTLLQGQVFLESQRERVVVPHISRKTSGIWAPSFAREREPDCCGTEFVGGFLRGLFTPPDGESFHKVFRSAAQNCGPEC